MQAALIRGPLISGALAALFLFSTPALAGNGLNDFAFNARAYGLGGADLATANDATAGNANPAGLAYIAQRSFSVYVEPYTNSGRRHRDGLGNDTGADAPYGASLGGGYAQRVKQTDIVVGLGFFAQGGAGFVYKDMRTPFGGQDELSSKFATVKLVPSLAWKASENLLIGAALGINYSAARQKLFPNTSAADPDGPEGPLAGFSGLRVDDQKGWSFNGKLGAQYRLNPQWLLAAAYTSETKIKLDDGELTLNLEADGLSRVLYRDSSQTGLNIAQEAGIGFAYTPTARWLMSAEINWVDWSSALKTSTLNASNPDSDQVPQTLSLTQRLDWRDQYVMAAGAEYHWSPLTTLRGGLNYGRNPVPDRTLTPLLPLTGETSVTLGFTRKLSGPWDVTAALLHQFRYKTRYTNPDFLFGPDNVSRFDAFALNLMITRTW